MFGVKRVELIHWRDSMTGMAWETEESLLELADDNEHFSIGFVVAETKTGIILAGSRSHVRSHSRQCFTNYIVIPKGAVIKRTKIGKL